MFKATKCPKCGFVSETVIEDCPSCGIIVEKYLLREKQRGAQPTISSGRSQELTGPCTAETGDWLPPLKQLVFTIPDSISPIGYWGRVLLLLILLFLSLRFTLASVGSNVAGGSFLHLVNLPFHEAGHLIFSPFGRLAGSLGGTLGQLMIPTVCLLVFLFRTRDAYSASISLWWLGENFMDIAPYINDARAGVLPLLGGNTGQSAPYGFHDWQFILSETGLLGYDQQLARLSSAIGAFLMVVGLTWGGLLLYKSYYKMGAAR